MDPWNLWKVKWSRKFLTATNKPQGVEVWPQRRVGTLRESCLEVLCWSCQLKNIKGDLVAPFRHWMIFAVENRADSNLERMGTFGKRNLVQWTRCWRVYLTSTEKKIEWWPENLKHQRWVRKTLPLESLCDGKGGGSKLFFDVNGLVFSGFLASDAQIIISMVIVDASISASLNESVAINKQYDKNPK